MKLIPTINPPKISTLDTSKAGLAVKPLIGVTDCTPPDRPQATGKSTSNEASFFGYCWIQFLLLSPPFGSGHL